MQKLFVIVLNAFRHHGIGHEPNPLFFFTASSAQRLPASWNRSQAIIENSNKIGVVLNAFRHHGIGHSPHATLYTSRVPSRCFQAGYP